MRMAVLPLDVDGSGAQDSPGPLLLKFAFRVSSALGLFYSFPQTRLTPSAYRSI